MSLSAEPSLLRKEDGQPLIGVVVMSSAGGGVSASDDGSYSLTVPAGTVLTFHAISYETVEYIVPSGSPAVTYDVVMASDSQLLEETVVVAYGVRKKGTITEERNHYRIGVQRKV